MSWLLGGDAGKFADALDDWMIDNKKNPKTKEDWQEVQKYMLKKGVLSPLGEVPDERLDDVKEHLKEEFNITDLNKRDTSDGNT